MTHADKGMNPIHFTSDPVDVRSRIRINPEIRIRIPYRFWPLLSLGYLSALVCHSHYFVELSWCSSYHYGWMITRVCGTWQADKLTHYNDVMFQNSYGVGDWLLCGVERRQLQRTYVMLTVHCETNSPNLLLRRSLASQRKCATICIFRSYNAPWKLASVNVLVFVIE